MISVAVGDCSDCTVDDGCCDLDSDSFVVSDCIVACDIVDCAAVVCDAVDCTVDESDTVDSDVACWSACSWLLCSVGIVYCM